MKRLSRHLTFANTMASIAVFLALGGGSFAVASHLKVRASDIQNDAVRSKHVKNGQVRTPDLAGGAVATGKLRGGAVTAGKLRNNAVNSAKVADGSLTGADIDEASLGQVPSATQANRAYFANRAGLADSATNADRLGGERSSAYQRRCQAGTVRGSARVKASSTFPSDYTTSSTYVDRVFTCSGGEFRVRRTGTGEYTIDLRADTGRSLIALATVEGSGEAVDDFATVDFAGAAGNTIWTVHVRDVDGGARDTPFYIVFF